MGTGNALVGRNAGDAVCNGGVVPLATNGNYVVVSRFVHASTPALGPIVGAVTWAPGTRGLVGTVGLDNSLFSGSARTINLVVTPLPVNGNYVVAFTRGGGRWRPGEDWRPCGVG